MKHLLLLIILFLVAILIANHPTPTENALNKAGYVGLNAFEYLAKELDKH